MCVLQRFAFPRIAEALEKRANAIRENIEASERQREEADELLAEYRQRLKEAREQAEDIAARARKSADAAVDEATAEGKAKREELVAAARKDIEIETRRSLEKIRREVADLTVLATEKVTRKSLDDADHQRLVEEALGEVDFSALAADANGDGEADELVEEIARVYSDALFGVAKESGKLDEIHEQLGEVADAIDRGPRPPGLLLQPLLLLAGEARRRSRRRSRAPRTSWSTSSSCSPRSTGCRRSSASARASTTSTPRRTSGSRSPLTSAVELDKEVVEKVGAEVERQTSRGIDMNTEVDEEILGGLVLQVGNRVLDASVRGRLEKLRKEVAQAA